MGWPTHMWLQTSKLPLFHSRRLPIGTQPATIAFPRIHVNAATHAKMLDFSFAQQDGKLSYLQCLTATFFFPGRQVLYTAVIL